MRKTLVFIIGSILFIALNRFIRITGGNYEVIMGTILGISNILFILIIVVTNISIILGGPLIYRYREKSRTHRRIKAAVFIGIGLAILFLIKYTFNNYEIDESKRFSIWMVFTYYVTLTGAFILSDYNGIQIREKMLVNCFSYYRWKRIKSFIITPDHLLKITVEKRFKDEEILMQLDRESGIQVEKLLSLKILA